MYCSHAYLGTICKVFGRHNVVSLPPNALLGDAPVCRKSPAPGLAGAPNAGNSPGLEAAQSRQLSGYMLAYQPEANRAMTR